MKIKNPTSKNNNKILLTKFSLMLSLMLILLMNLSLISQPNIKLNFKDKTQKVILANEFQKITFMAIEEPKPIIQANDYDFGTFDIKETTFKTTKIVVSNQSNEADLIVISYDMSDIDNFKTNINEVLMDMPLIIPMGGFIEIDFEFTPKTVGQKECNVTFNSNADSIDNVIELTGMAVDTNITSIEDIQINEINDSFVISSPPYPNPTQNEVTANLVWNNRIHINNAEFGVFDLNGNKVSNNDNLILEMLNENSANIKWNCSGMQSGTYIIQIQQGNSSKYVKVIVN